MPKLFKWERSEGIGGIQKVIHEKDGALDCAV